jgi:hypothetical protein
MYVTRHDLNIINIISRWALLNQLAPRPTPVDRRQLQIILQMPFRMNVQKALTWGVETKGQRSTYPSTCIRQPWSFFLGILPIPLDERTDKPYSKIFFIWFSVNINILSYEEFPASQSIVC